MSQSSRIDKNFWISSTEVLSVRDNGPMLLVIINRTTKREQPLPKLSALWKAQEEFSSNALYLSPDGQWLLGMAGTKQRPTWIATRLRDSEIREWPRETAKSLWPPVAWMRDCQHWVEIASVYGPDTNTWIENGGQSYKKLDFRGVVVRVRSLDSAGKQEYPLNFKGAEMFRDTHNFTFTDDGRAWLTQVTNGTFPGDTPETRRSQATFYEVIPGQKKWTVHTSVFGPPPAQYPGGFDECKRSPRGDWLIWRNYIHETRTVRIFISRPDGSEMHPVWEKVGLENEWPGTFQWLPDGNHVSFWWGQGLYVIPIC